MTNQAFSIDSLRAATSKLATEDAIYLFFSDAVPIACFVLTAGLLAVYFFLAAKKRQSVMYRAVLYGASVFFISLSAFVGWGTFIKDVSPTLSASAHHVLQADAFLLNRPVATRVSVVNVFQARTRVQGTVAEVERLQRKLAIAGISMDDDKADAALALLIARR